MTVTLGVSLSSLSLSLSLFSLGVRAVSVLRVLAEKRPLDSLPANQAGLEVGWLSLAIKTLSGESVQSLPVPFVHSY